MWRTVKKSSATNSSPLLAAGLATCALLLLLFSAPARGAVTVPADDLALGGFALLLVVAVAVRATLPPKRQREFVLILGNGQIAGQLRRDLSANGKPRAQRYEPSVVDPSHPDESAAKLREMIANQEISEVVITDPSISTHADVTSLLIECKFRGVKISRAPEFYEGIHEKVWLEALRPEAFVYSDAVNLSPVYLALKRVIDLSAALVVFVLTFPLMLLIALAVRLESPGPVLFRQERLGRFGTPFMLYKFRSMRSDAEKEGPMWAQKNDSRVTRVGRVLRRTHLDELPQIFNVLKNDLSFVGPRPERECFVSTLEKQIPYFRLREYVKPGITGWAQVSAEYGDSVLASAEKLRFDLYYAKHASTLFDLKILLLTVWHVAFGRGR